jgi:putative DNA primase/helicase
MKCRIGLLPGIDIKADGGYVVAPGSIIDGNDYEWIDPEAHLISIPEAILNLLNRKKTIAPKLNEVLLDGLRNITLASLAGTMRRRGMTDEEIKAALMAVNTQRCHPPLPDSEVEKIATSIARYLPQAKEDDDVMPPGFTDDALALEFTKLHALDWRYVAAWGSWLHWEANRWLKETTLKAYDLARLVCRKASARCLNPKIAAKVASASTVAAVEKLARADRKHAATVSQWDSDILLINTSGEVINLKTGETKPHDRAYYMTKIASARLSDIKPFLWLKFLNDITKGDTDLQDYLARMAGYALTGITTEHALFFLYGTGANGKSVFVNTLAAVMGDYAVSAPIDTFLETKTDKHPTDLASLRGARLVTSIEVEKGKRWAEAKIKSLTGGDRIAARFMRQDFFEYKPQFKLIIAGNNKPAIRDVDEAMKRRLHLVPFTVTIPVDKRDKNLSETLLIERDGILRWMVDGCLEWQKIGLNPPTCVISATEEYLESEDALGRWIEEECIENPNALGTTNELFDSWKGWAEKNGEYYGTKRRFSDDMDKRGFKRRRSGHGGSHAFQGIGLKGKVVQETIL